MKNNINNSIGVILIVACSILSILFSCATTQQTQLKSNDAVVHNNRGFDYCQIGQYDQAISDFSKAIEIDPGLVEAYFHRAVGYFLVGEYEKSLLDVMKAQQLGYQIPIEFLDDLRKATGGIDV